MSPAPTAATTTPGTAADGTAAAGTAALPPTTGRWPIGYRPPSQREGYDRTPNRRQRITESGPRPRQLPDFSSGRKAAGIVVGPGQLPDFSCGRKAAGIVVGPGQLPDFSSGRRAAG